MFSHNKHKDTYNTFHISRYRQYGPADLHQNRYGKTYIACLNWNNIDICHDIVFPDGTVCAFPLLSVITYFQFKT